MRRRIPEMVVFILLAVFFAPLCGWLFSCGCTHLWSGADHHCSIHDPERADCPWCAQPKQNALYKAGYHLLPFGLIYGSALGAIFFLRNKRGAHPVTELLAGALVALMAMVALGKVYAILLDYPSYRF